MAGHSYKKNLDDLIDNPELFFSELANRHIFLNHETYKNAKEIEKCYRQMNEAEKRFSRMLKPFGNGVFSK